MPIFLRILSAANTFREWFSFANEAVSLLGLAKRAAVVGAVSATVAAPVVIASKPGPSLQQLQSAREAVQVAPAPSDIDLEECATGQCSVTYLVQDERRIKLAEKIARACETTTRVSHEQCAAAARVVAALRAAEADTARAKRMEAARAEAPVGKLPMHFFGGK